MANKPRKLTFAANTTGASTAYAGFPTGCGSAYATFNNVTTSTKCAVKLQGSIGGSGTWFDISAVTTLTTGEDSFGSTATVVFDRVRVLKTGKSTSTGTNYAHVIARP